MTGRSHPTLIIVNNAAAKAKRVWPEIRTLLVEAGIAFEEYQTRGPDDATAQTRSALHAGCETVVVVGGDGTLSEVAAGFFEFRPDDEPRAINCQASLAILPAGTGDDFARGLRGQRISLGDWVTTLINYLLRPTEPLSIDVLFAKCAGAANGFICLNAATMGIGGETAVRVSAQGALLRRASGETRFMVAAVGALLNWRERLVRVHVDNKPVIEGPMNLVAVANGLYAGGGMMLSPQAKPIDGKLDVVTASGLSRWEVIRELPRLHSGGHVANPKVSIWQGTKVVIETLSPADELLIEADGNVRGKTPAEFHILPAALRFVV